MPIAMTLLGIGGVPAHHPLNLGMMGMHGEAWVNTAIQEADLLIALGMRFDDRVTGNLQTYALNAKKIHVDIDRAELNKNVRVDVAHRRRICGRRSASGCRSSSRTRAGVARAHQRAQRRFRGPRHPEPARQRPSLRGARHQRSLAAHGRQRRRRDRRRPAPDVGSAVLQARLAALAHHLGRSRHDGLRAAGGDRREDGVARRGSLGGRRRRRLPDDDVRAGDGRAGRFDINICIINNGYLGMVRQWQEFFYQRRYAATPITGPDFVKLAEAFGIWGTRGRPARATSRARSTRARRQPRRSLIDFRVEQEDSVYPMVPAGADLDKMIRRPSPIRSWKRQRTERRRHAARSRP